jgi:hypothetical protein
MRKLTVPALITTVALLGFAPSALAVNADQSIKITLSSKKAGTKKKPKRESLKIAIATTPKDSVPFATRKTVLFFDKNLVFSPKAFKTCTAARLQQGESSCPQAARVGSGTARGAAIGQVQNLKVTAYNGPKSTILLHVTGATPLQIDSVIVGTLSRSSGAYGSRLTVPIPENLQQPVPGVFATLTSFITTVRGQRHGTPYVGLKGCSGGRLRFKGTFTFTDNSVKTATDTVRCSKR